MSSDVVVEWLELCAKGKISLWEGQLFSAVMVHSCWCLTVVHCLPMQDTFESGTVPGIGGHFPMGGQEGRGMMPQPSGGMQV